MSEKINEKKTEKKASYLSAKESRRISREKRERWMRHAYGTEGGNASAQDQITVHIRVAPLRVAENIIPYEAESETAAHKKSSGGQTVRGGD